MNFFRVRGALISGLQVIPVEVECAQARRLPFLQILGASRGDAVDQRERVIAALSSLERGKFRLPSRRFTVQLRPGAQGMPIEQLDLAVALAVLGSCGKISTARLSSALVCGRLGLDGGLQSVGTEAAIGRFLRGEAGSSALLPWEGSELLEESHLKNGGGFRSLAEVVSFLRGTGPGQRRSRPEEVGVPPPESIWDRVRGQELALRVIEIAAAGFHHVLFSGPIAARADLLAHALSSLLPPLRAEEFEEVREIYSLAGVGAHPLSRPFHVFGSADGLPSLLGDSAGSTAEEALLAHHGVLFLDLATEMRDGLSSALSTLMREGALFSRMAGQRTKVAAQALVVAALPSCFCGARGDSRLVCTCRPTEARRFRARWRRLPHGTFDLVCTLGHARGRGAPEFDWKSSAARVELARERMRARQGCLNGRLGEEDLFRRVPWAADARRIWTALEARETGNRESFLAFGRVAATICDLREGDRVEESDLFEARHYFPALPEDGPARTPARPSVPETNSIAIPYVRSP